MIPHLPERLVFDIFITCYLLTNLQEPIRKDIMQTPEDFLEANGFACKTLDRSALVSMFLKEMEAGLKGEA